MSSILQRAREKEGKTFKQKLKRFLLGSSLAIGTIAISPGLYEAAHISIKKSSIENAITKITTEKAHLCAPSGAQSLNAQQKQKLTNIANNVFSSKITPLSDIGNVYKSGVKRFISIIPGKTTLADLANSAFTVPTSYLVDNYATDIDEIDPYLDKVASLGIGVCFDTRLDDKKLGSAFSPQTGMITLNPSLDETVLSIHLHRQLNHLNGALVTPFTQLTEAVSSGGVSYSAIKDIAEVSNAIVKADVTALKKDADPNTDDFITIKASKYQPKLQTPKA